MRNSANFLTSFNNDVARYSSGIHGSCDPRLEALEAGCIAPQEGGTTQRGEADHVLH